MTDQKNQSNRKTKYLLQTNVLCQRLQICILDLNLSFIVSWGDLILCTTIDQPLSRREKLF